MTDNFCSLNLSQVRCGNTCEAGGSYSLGCALPDEGQVVNEGKTLLTLVSDGSAYGFLSQSRDILCFLKVFRHLEDLQIILLARNHLRVNSVPPTVSHENKIKNTISHLLKHLDLL